MAAGAGGKNPDIKGGAGNRRREGRKWDSQGSGNCEIIGGKLLQHHKIFSTRKSTIKKLEPLRKGSDGVKGMKSKKFRPSVSSPPPKKKSSEESRHENRSMFSCHLCTYLCMWEVGRTKK